ncbi:unnamed protein product, partial [Arabis nemorensis]
GPRLLCWSVLRSGPGCGTRTGSFRHEMSYAYQLLLARDAACVLAPSARDTARVPIPFGMGFRTRTTSFRHRTRHSCRLLQHGTRQAYRFSLARDAVHESEPFEKRYDNKVVVLLNTHSVPKGVLPNALSMPKALLEKTFYQIHRSDHDEDEYKNAVEDLVMRSGPKTKTYVLK